MTVTLALRSSFSLSSPPHFPSLRYGREVTVRSRETGAVKGGREVIRGTGEVNSESRNQEIYKKLSLRISGFYKIKK